MPPSTNNTPLNPDRILALLPVHSVRCSPSTPSTVRCSLVTRHCLRPLPPGSRWYSDDLHSRSRLFSVSRLPLVLSRCLVVGVRRRLWFLFVACSSTLGLTLVSPNCIFTVYLFAHKSERLTNYSSICTCVFVVGFFLGSLIRCQLVSTVRFVFGCRSVCSCPALF